MAEDLPDEFWLAKFGMTKQEVKDWISRIVDEVCEEVQKKEF